MKHLRLNVTVKADVAACLRWLAAIIWLLNWVGGGVGDGPILPVFLAQTARSPRADVGCFDGGYFERQWHYRFREVLGEAR